MDAPDPKISDHVALAWLEGAVIRQLLGMDAAAAEPAIELIWPTRFEVIIDINLAFEPLESGSGDSAADVSEFEHPDPRRVAKALIKKYVEKAKKAVRVTDSDQGVDNYKTEVTSQYVFARLEGSVIKALVGIDQREAQKLLHQQFGAEYTGEKAVTNFQQAVRGALRKITVVYPDLVLGHKRGGIEVLPSCPPAITSRG